MADTVEGLVKPVAWQCTGCGRTSDDPDSDLASIRAAGGLSCCPERKLEPLYPASALEALVVERDALAHDLRLVQERKDNIEAQRDKLRAGLEYAAMGLGRIHDYRRLGGPKQASGEMTAYFRDRARSTLDELAG